MKNIKTFLNYRHKTNESYGYYSHDDFNTTKFYLVIDFLKEFSEYSISDLIINIEALERYKGDYSELFASLAGSDKYQSVGSNEDRLKYKLLSFIIDRPDDYTGNEN